MERVDAMLGDVARAVRSFRAHHPSRCGELEVRLGNTKGDGSFGPGVSDDTFLELERDLEEAVQLTSDARWQEIIDYFHSTSTGSAIRTRVEFDHETMLMTQTHIEKRPLHTMTASIGHVSGACRLCVATETPVSDLPVASVVNFVRVKQRRRFWDRRDDNVVWVYELSRTWSATTRDAVEEAQKREPPVFEVECELMDAQGTYLAQRTDECVARSILLKMAMLMGGEDTCNMTTLECRHAEVEHTRKRRARR
jgi:hypothetical protein